MIEVQIRKHLIGQDALKPYMASYAGNMAIFNQEAPSDMDSLWETENQYGRIVFYIDMQDDPERNISGTLGVDLSCLKDSGHTPEDIEPILRNLIDGYFFSNESVTIAAQWRNTQYFTEPAEKVIGATLVFDLLDFPKQETNYPDPINLINQWTAKELAALCGVEGIKTIGYDSLPDAWKPTKENPAIYWRLGIIRNCNWIPDTYNCSWETATIHGHVMAPDNATATKVLRVIQNTLIVKKRLIFEDLSPLMIDRNIQVNPAGDPLRNGQMSIEGTYGILNISTAKPKSIENVKIY